MSDPVGRDEANGIRASIRQALLTAAAGPEPDVGPLVAAVPRIMAEARRRRVQVPETPLTAVVPLATKAIPRLAAAAAVLVLLATVLFATDRSRTSSDRQDLDSMLLGGADAGGVEDLILGKATRRGNTDG